MAPPPSRKLRVGIIGGGEVAQVIHLPALTLLNHLYTVHAICDISAQTALHCATKFNIPNHSIHPSSVIKSPFVDIIFILTADEYHESLCIEAIQAGKHVFVEKPITLSLPSVDRILQAERMAGGNKVFVGYMRRYAPSFTGAFLREIETIPRILYARVRDIIGPNAHFIGQSGTSPVKFTDFPEEARKDSEEKLRNLMGEAFEGREPTQEEIGYCRFLGGLGSHDLSLMREALGPVESVVAVTANEPFYTAIFHYKNRKGEKDPFSVTYESGIDNVPRFDAHLTVYGESKSVSIHYDTPYIKGLPIVVKVDEVNAHGERCSREILSSYEDAYTVELKEVWSWIVEGKGIKTATADARGELQLYDSMYKQLEKQRLKG